jgi:hypothetical protein
MPLSSAQLLLLGLAVDLVYLCAVVILGLAHVLPSEAVVGLLGTGIGARALSGRGGGGGGPGSGGTSSPPPAARGVAELGGGHRGRLRDWSSIAALVHAVGALLTPSPARA